MDTLDKIHKEIEDKNKDSVVEKTEEEELEL